MIDYGHGVTLRRIEEEDLPALFQWRNDYRVWRWCRQFEPLHHSKHMAWFQWQASDKSVSMFAVLDREGDIVGVCGLTDIDQTNRRAEFSLYIDPDRGGQGYGKAALRTLFKHGFDRLGMNVIWGETFDENPAAHLFESVGMTIEGTRRDFYFREGKFVDAHLYSLRRHNLK